MRVIRAMFFIFTAPFFSSIAFAAYEPGPTYAQSGEAGTGATGSGLYTFSFAPGVVGAMSPTSTAALNAQPASVDPALAAEQQRLYEEDMRAYQEQQQQQADQMANEQERMSTLQSLMSGFSGGGMGGGLFNGGGGGSGGGSFGGGSGSMGGGGSGFGYKSPLPPGTCNQAVNSEFMKDFMACKSAKYENVKARPALIMNTDQKIGYQVDGNGGILRCFRITIGARGVGRGGNPDGDKLTEVGFFTAQYGQGVKYNTGYREYPRKCIGMGVPGEKWIHMARSGATNGCIGVEPAMWKTVFDSVQLNQSSVFVWSSKWSGSNRVCTGSPGAAGAPPSVRPTSEMPATS